MMGCLSVTFRNLEQKVSLVHCTQLMLKSATILYLVYRGPSQSILISLCASFELCAGRSADYG